jgi:hypothetical protein
MSAYGALTLAHIVCGAVALISCWLAALLRKGSSAHRRSGQVYLVMMVAIIVTGALMALARFREGHLVAGAFLGFLAIFTANSTWRMWRAIKDRNDSARYTGVIFQISAWSVLVYSLLVVGLGVAQSSILMIGLGLIGTYAGMMLLRQRMRREQLAARPRWWIVQHYRAVLANGIATHVAFLTLGLPRLLPMLGGEALVHVAWFGPVVIALVVGRRLDRRFAAA